MARIMLLMAKAPVLWMLRSTVVMPKAISPRGPGLAVMSCSVAETVRCSPIGPVALASAVLGSSLIYRCLRSR